MNKNKYKHTKDYRAFVIKSLGNKCEDCGAGISLVIHHKKYQKKLELTDLSLLCTSCHAKVHSSIKRPKISANLFQARVSKQGRKRIINVPNVLKTFQPGDNVKVKKVQK